MSGLTVAEHELIGIQKRAAKLQIESTLSKREQVALAIYQSMITNSTHHINDTSINQAYLAADAFLKKSGNK